MTSETRFRGVEDAVSFFSQAKQRLKYKGNDDLLWCLKKLEETSTTTGLSPEQITTLVDVAASGLQIETVNKKIIKCLVPSTVVPDIAVLKVVSWLCTRKPTLGVQCLLLRWVILVYEYIDTLKNIHSLYGVLFFFLHYKTLMPYICHLLYLLTRKEDVKLFRVRQLIQYQRDMGNKTYLTGLLSIYRHYYPNLVHVVIPRTYKSFFPLHHTDRQWNELIQQVREGLRVPPEPDMTWDRTLKERLYPTGNTVDLVPSRKRRKLDSIPVIHSLTTKTNHKQDSLEHLLGLSKIPFVQVKTLEDVLANIDSIEFPSQIGAVLCSSTLQNLLSYTKDPVATTRFHFWVSETLQEVLNNKKERDKPKTREFLQALLTFTDFIQEGVPAVDIVFTNYLRHWNGLDYVPLVLKHLARSRMYSFELLEDTILKPLRKLFFMSSVFFKCQVTVCFTELLHNYAANEWPRYQEVGSSGGRPNDNSCLTLFSRSSTDFDGIELFKKLIGYISRLLLLATINHKHHALLESCILDFLDLVCTLHRIHNLPFVVLAEPRLLETLMISPNPVTVGRVCLVVNGYKTNIAAMKLQQRAGQIEISPSYVTHMVMACNQLIIDFCNTLWRAKSFRTNDKSSVFYFNPEMVDKLFEGENTAEIMSLYRHFAFLAFAVKFIKKEDLGPLNDFSIIKQHRADFVHFLEAYHLDSISKFISFFIRRPSRHSSISTPSKASSTQILGITQNVTQTQDSFQ